MGCDSRKGSLSAVGGGIISGGWCAPVIVGISGRCLFVETTGSVRWCPSVTLVSMGREFD